MQNRLKLLANGNGNDSDASAEFVGCDCPVGGVECDHGERDHGRRRRDRLVEISGHARRSGTGSAARNSIRASAAAWRSRRRSRRNIRPCSTRSWQIAPPADSKTTATAACLPAGMPRAMIGYEPLGIHRHARDHLHQAAPTCRSCVASTPTDAIGRSRSSRPLSAIRSANGSMRTATAATTCSWSRPAASRARAPIDGSRHAVPQGQPDRRQGAHLSRQGRSQRPARRHHGDRPRADAVPGPWHRKYKRAANRFWSEYICGEGNQQIISARKTTW